MARLFLILLLFPTQHAVWRTSKAVSPSLVMEHSTALMVGVLIDSFEKSYQLLKSDGLRNVAAVVKLVPRPLACLWN